MREIATVESRLLRMFTAEMNLEVSDADIDLIETGILDSLTFVDLLFRLEQEFGVKVAMESIETEQFRTIKKIAAFVLSARAA